MASREIPSANANEFSKNPMGIRFMPAPMSQLDCIIAFVAGALTCAAVIWVILLIAALYLRAFGHL